MTTWTHFVGTFSANRADLGLAAKFIRSTGVPCTTDVLLYHLLQCRLADAQCRSRDFDFDQLSPDTVIYQQAGDYQVGQRIFIASENQMAIVEKKWPDRYATTKNGLHTVWYSIQCIRVRLENGTVKKWVCAAPFLDPTLPVGSNLGDVIEQFGKPLRGKLKRCLWRDPNCRFVSFDRQWFLRDLLTANDTDTAEEVEVFLLQRGIPASVLEIAHCLFEDVSDSVGIFSLGVLLKSSPDQFRVVRESPPPVLWFVKEYPIKVEEPKGISVPPVPRRIIEKNPRFVTVERRGKRRKKTSARRKRRVEFAIPIGYREGGTIPLNNRTAGIFPSGSGDIPLIFIDARGGSLMKGGVSHEEEYAWGIRDWLDNNGIPAGGQIVLERTESEFEIKIDYVPAARTQIYSIRVVKWVDGELLSYTRQITPECEVDRAMYEYSTIFEDPDAMWAEATDAIFDIICYVVPALAKGDPDDAVHYRTISSAVSYIRRCAPSTVWTLLSTCKCFQQVEGKPGFWSLDRNEVVGLQETEIVRYALLPKIITVDDHVRALQVKLSALENKVQEQALRLKAAKAIQGGEG